MKNKILIFYIFCLSFGSHQAAEFKSVESDSAQIQIDTSSVLEPLFFDRTRLSEYKKSKDFDYTEVPVEDSWWTQLKHWLQEWWHKLLASLFDIDEVSGAWLIILEILPYLLLLGILGLIVWLFIRGKVGRMLDEKEEFPDSLFQEDQEIIKNQNIYQLIEHAVAKANYRLAIRYQYLLVIKLLSDEDHILLVAQKTNADYVLELESTLLKSGFKDLTQVYNFIWYGNFEVDSKNYKRFEIKFEQFRNMITSASI
ncbi:hypothetical protein ACJRPK_13560 [Aquimarina sp. 2-A2]|uniref:hypothetical protein n=1 Tax=Aquimarina sp. 2-A2 TaxID=3382644 RepID=UPI00387F35B0